MRENGNPCVNIYGPIPGKEVGVAFVSRRELYCIHNSILPIDTGPEGPLSILLLKNQNLNDHGYLVGFSTGETQKYLGDKNAAPEGQFNRNLMISIRSQLPIRVVRASLLKNCFAPPRGFRYDGLYCCKSYETDLVRNKLVFKFLLSRLENQPPVPWEDGFTVTPSSNVSNDLVEITGEQSYNKIISDEDALDFAIEESFCLRDEEYSRIETSEYNQMNSPPCIKEEMEFQNTEETIEKDHKPLVLSSNRVFTVDSDVDNGSLANLLLASGVISKEVQIGNNFGSTNQRKNTNTKSYSIYECSDEYSDSDSDEVYHSIKMENADIKPEINSSIEDQNDSNEISKDTGVDQQDYKMEYFSPISNDNRHDIVRDRDVIIENEVPTIKMENSTINSAREFQTKLDYLRINGGISSTPINHRLDYVDNFSAQNSTEPVEVIRVNNSPTHPSIEVQPSAPITVKVRDSLEDEVITIKTRDSPEPEEIVDGYHHMQCSSEQTHEYIYVKTSNSPENDSTPVKHNHPRTDNLHLMRADDNVNGAEYVVVSPKYFELLKNGHLMADDESVTEESRNHQYNNKEKSSHVISGIRTLTFDGDDCVLNLVNGSQSDGENDVEPLEWWKETYVNPETDNKIKPPSPHSSDFDIKINPNYFQSLKVDESSSAYCKKCTPPLELIEPLLGQLSSSFSFFYLDFFCKCKSNSRINLNNRNIEYFNKITDLVVALKNKNVQYVSAILAFLLCGSQAEMFSNEQPSSNQKSSNMSKGKQKLTLKDNNNTTYNLIESDGKFSLMCEEKRNSSTGRIELDNVTFEGELVSIDKGNMENIEHEKSISKIRSKRTTVSLNKPARKRKQIKKGVHKGVTYKCNKRSTGVSCGKSSLSVDPSNVQPYLTSPLNMFVGFNDYDIRISESQRDISLDGMSKHLIYPTLDFRGFTRPDLQKCRYDQNSFDSFTQRKLEFNDNNT